MKRWMPSVLALVAVQALLVGGWWLVEKRRSRTEPAPVPATLVTQATFQRSTGPAPELSFSRRDGSPGSLSGERERVVVHFWATWCPPCLEELPSLLLWSERSGVELLAVSVDPTWGAVDRFLPGPMSPAVVLSDAEAARRWGAHGLPTTFVIERGQLAWVARGPVDWSGRGLP